MKTFVNQIELAQKKKLEETKKGTSDARAPC
jgi:hypothetical protein